MTGCDGQTGRPRRWTSPRQQRFQQGCQFGYSHAIFLKFKKKNWRKKRAANKNWERNLLACLTLSHLLFSFFFGLPVWPCLPHFVHLATLACSLSRWRQHQSARRRAARVAPWRRCSRPRRRTRRWRARRRRCPRGRWAGTSGGSPRSAFPLRWAGALSSRRRVSGHLQEGSHSAWLMATLVATVTSAKFHCNASCFQSAVGTYNPAVGYQKYKTGCKIYKQWVPSVVTKTGSPETPLNSPSREETLGGRNCIVPRRRPNKAQEGPRKKCNYVGAVSTVL